MFPPQYLFPEKNSLASEGLLLFFNFTLNLIWFGRKLLDSLFLRYAPLKCKWRRREIALSETPATLIKSPL